MIWVESVSSDQSNDHHNVIRNNHLLKTQRKLIDYCTSPSPSGVIKENQYASTRTKKTRAYSLWLQPQHLANSQ